jgi:hypothetical protein
MLCNISNSRQTRQLGGSLSASQIYFLRAVTSVCHSHQRENSAKFTWSEGTSRQLTSRRQHDASQNQQDADRANELHQ